MKNNNDFLTHVPPMGIYETLYAFQNSYGSYMGEKGTHPWSQGFPLTTQIPGGPEMPNPFPLIQMILNILRHGDNQSFDKQLQNIIIIIMDHPSIMKML